jgi:hypothetical protein
MILSMEANGAVIKVFEKADIGNTETMKSIIDDIDKNMPKIKGVCHLAELIDDDLLMHLN